MNSKIRLLPYLLLLVAIFCLIPFHPPLSRLSANEKIMGIDEIKAGMKGYGKTVFKGSNIGIFHVEVLGVMKNWEAKSDMILIKMTGDPIENTGIIAGMSGSPVYIHNRLIGAVAYGWSFSKEAIAGVSPINEMRNTLLNLPLQEESDFPVAETDWDLFPASDQKPQGETQTNSRFSDLTKMDNANNIQLTPILSPLAVSGIKNEALQNIKNILHLYGLHPVQSGNCVPAFHTVNSSEPVPGAAVAAVLIRGDLNAAVVGTVTYREGNKILAFGHPFLQTGNSNIPLASAYVYAILSSQSNSVKMASPLKIIGRIEQDRKSGIAGTLGEFARMIPCRIEISGAQKRVYEFELADNNLLIPGLVLTAAQSAVLSTEKKLGNKSVYICLSTQIEGQDKPLILKNVFFEFDQSWQSLNYILKPFALMVNNPFQKIQLNKIDLKITVLDKRQTAYIESMKVNKKQISPGETLQIDVHIRPFTGDGFYETVEIKIPEDTLPGSTLNVTVCDARYSQSLNRGRSPGKYSPTNFKQLLQYLESLENNNHLMIRVLLAKRGLTFKGEGLPSLPSSIRSIMSLSNQSGVGPLYDELITHVQTPYILRGKQDIPVSVQ